MQRECEELRSNSSGVGAKACHVVRESWLVVIVKQRGLADQFRTIGVVEEDIAVTQGSFGPTGHVTADKLQLRPVDPTLGRDIHRTEVWRSCSIGIVDTARKPGL